MRIAKRAGIVFVLLIIIALAGQPVAAQSVSSHWFPETRHSVSGPFFNFFYGVKDPLTMFGYPITNAFRDSTGRLTQYFQRARFDLVTTNRVRLSSWPTWGATFTRISALTITSPRMGRHAAYSLVPALQSAILSCRSTMRTREKHISAIQFRVSKFATAAWCSTSPRCASNTIAAFRTIE